MTGLEQFSLNGRRVLVTGSTNGLGFAAACLLAEAGAEVWVNGRSRKRVDAALSRMPGTARPLVLAQALDPDRYDIHLAADPRYRDLMEDMRRMEKEMENLTREFKLVEQSHRDSIYNLVIVVAFLRKLLDNARVVRYLSQNYAEILAEFQRLIETNSFDPQPALSEGG